MEDIQNTAFYRHFFSPEAKEGYKKIFPGLFGPSTQLSKEKKPKIKKSKRDTIYRHIRATPLVEVLSIRIGSLLGDGERPTICEIYGQISIVDTRLSDDGEIFQLFHKNEDDPQSMRLDEPLLLSPSSRNAVIIPSENTMLDVRLFDRKASNKAVAQGRLSLDKIGDECEEDHRRKVFGKDELSFADVHYTVFQYAVAATVDVLFFKEADNHQLSGDDTVNSNYGDDDDDDSGEYVEESSDEMDLSHYNDTVCKDSRESFVTDVYGSVTVHSNVKYGNDKGYPSISLFNKSPGQGVQVKSGAYIPLSKSIVVVPAYASSLVVDVNLSDHNTRNPIANGILEFKPRDQDTFKKDLVGEHGRVRVRVTWNHASDQALNRASQKKQERQKPEEIEDSNWDPYQAMELFSVVVHSKDFKPFSFYGTIDVNEMVLFRLFCRDKIWPHVSAKGDEQVTIRGPYIRSVSAADYFQIRVDLKDATTGAQISNGYASWDSRLIRQWLDRRVCSVMRGERGFAVVHYTAFSDAISVRVDVKLLGGNLEDYVYGKIVARYDTYDYSTSYVNKYYQIILFDKHKIDNGCQKVRPSRSNLHLLKPLVCLPRNCSLVIEVDLTLSSKPATPLHGKLHLKPGKSDRLCGESWGIEVHLKSESAVL